jgi:protease I
MTTPPAKPASDDEPIGSTRPAGAGLSDAEAAAEVARQTSSDMNVEDVFEREADGTATDTPAAELSADEVEEISP